MLERVQRKGSPLTLLVGSKLVQPLWKTLWRFLKKLKIELPYNTVTQSFTLALNMTLKLNLNLTHDHDLDPQDSDPSHNHDAVPNTSTDHYSDPHT